MTLPLLDITAPVPAGLDALLDSAALEVVLDEMRVEVDGGGGTKMTYAELETSFDALDASVRQRFARDAAEIASFRARYTKLELAAVFALDAPEDRYDGAPDSDTLWMGEHIRDLKAAIAAGGQG